MNIVRKLSFPMSISPWKSLGTAVEELRLDTTLNSGQSFRWRQTGADEWSCVLHGYLISLKQTSTTVLYRAYNSNSTSENGVVENDHYPKVYEILQDYFRLHLSYVKECKRWSKDSNFARVVKAFSGHRLLKLDPIECLFSFICSSNNNVARISQMIDKLCQHYGKKIGTLNGHDFHDFPSLEALAGSSVEMELRRAGFGYRAKYIMQTAKYIMDNYPEKEAWLYGLKSLSYKEAREKLLQLSGVGPKVADCVLLLSLEQHEAIPIDTHVYQIACRYYGFRPAKSLTPKIYEAIQTHLQKQWSPYSGWAHQVLFTADLRRYALRVNDINAGDAIVKREVTTVPHLKRKQHDEAELNGSMEKSSVDKRRRKGNKF
ncbi:uncharacterized protein VTP21DRAFT_2052 [Calcarisporiella thermophila]|uniref:uncharacterized protein n=1 Tax=Calcarisporiella thermophila TaxID=911321 RepID=UPI00374343C8